MQHGFLKSGEVAMKTTAVLALGVCLFVGSAAADTMKVGAKQYKGNFEGYDSGKFVFRTSDGKFISESRAKVRELKLDKPRKADLVKTSGTKSEAVMLRGYAGSKFSYTKKGKAGSMPGMHVRRITVEIPMVAGGGAGGTEAKPIAAIDISGLEGRGDLTAAQSAAVAGYKSARQTYDKFMAESSALVAKMDSLKGAARESVLNTLRSRKDQEQPIKNTMISSQNELLAAFPNGFPTGPEITRGGAGGDREPVLEGTEIVLVIPKLGPNEICILDTTVLKNGPLNDAQKAALAGYDKATQSYANFANAPDADAASDKAAALMNGLQNAHSTLLKAFPNLKLVPEGSQ